MLSFKQYLTETGMGDLHAAIKAQYPHHEPLRIVHSTEHKLVVSAFNRSVGRERWYHAFKKDKKGTWQHHSAHRSENLARDS